MTSLDQKASSRGLAIRAIIVASLGYFVDVYDLILFSIVRVKSLGAIGVPKERMLDQGVLLLDMQMIGMLIGGVVWGIIGDKRGRLSVLFGSIFLYSLANGLNGFVTTVPEYACLRLLAGFGLAGELGAGITLVSELMPRESRGYGTSIVASVGILGGLVAVLMGDTFDWRVAYWVGGGLGLMLLLFRIGVAESGLFRSTQARTQVKAGDILSLFKTGKRASVYIASILIGIPSWYVVGILVTFSPEISAALGMQSPRPDASHAVLYCYIGLSSGDLASGLISQWLKNRKRVVLGFQIFTVLSILAYFCVGSTSRGLFYLVCLALGFGVGYWALFVTMASEQFGTHIRATVTTTAPNFARGALVPIAALFQAAKPWIGVWQSALAAGVVCLALAILGLSQLEETFGRDLDFTEN